MSYVTATASSVIKIREEAKSVLGEKPVSINSLSPPKVSMSHQAILNGPHASNCSIEKKKKLELLDLPESMIYKFLQNFVMKPDNLKIYGYPMPHETQVGTAVLPEPDKKTLKNDYSKNFRHCSRCSKIFRVTEDGVPVKKDDSCVYHSGRIWNERSGGSVNRKYNCCKQDPSSGGCTSNTFHVVDGIGHPDYNKGFVKTVVKRVKDKYSSPGIYALDCEMVCLLFQLIHLMS